MKSSKKLRSWFTLLLLMACIINTTAQDPYPVPGDHAVCLNSTDPYGVVFNSGSTYAWSITPLANGNGTITPGVTQNLISVNWISLGTATLSVIETNSSGCEGAPVSIVVTVNPSNTIQLTSAAGTDIQTVCINTAIDPITYATTGATGATVTGLPAGVTGTWASNVVTITGTPSTATGSPFTYTVSLTGGCGTVTKTGTITVTPDNTMQLTSAAGTASQTVCINTAIDPITYATTGATGATVTGLPAGVTGTWASNVVTITGTPSTVTGSPFTYTVSLTGGCGTVTETGTITVTPNNTIQLTSAAGTDIQTVCINTAIDPITYATTGATGATVTGLPAGVTGTWVSNVVTISGTPSTVTGSPFTYTITLTGGCGTVSETGTIRVNALPTTSPITHN
jgi:hypothetical protein